MKRIWTAGLILSLACRLGLAGAGEPLAPAGRASPSSVPVLGQPVAADDDDDPVAPAIHVAPAAPLPPRPVAVLRFQAGDEVVPASASMKDGPTLFAADVPELSREPAEPAVQAPLPTPLPPGPAPLPAAPQSAGPLNWPAPPTPMMAPLPRSGPVGSGPVMDEGTIPDLHDEMSGEMAAPPGTAQRLYVSTEYLLWWIKDPSNPALVTTGPSFPVGTVHPTSGFLGAPGTEVLNGGTVPYDPLSGFRITAGIYLDDCQHTSLETTYFALGPQDKHFLDTSDGSNVIARPFVSQNTGMPFAQYTAAPGFSSGAVSVGNSTRLWGLEENLRCNLCCGCGSRLDLIAGVRYLELDDGVQVMEDVNVSPLVTVPPGLAGTRGTVYDAFGTRNQFLGGQLGLDYEIDRGPWSLDFRGKVALGNTHELLKIEGNQTVTPPGGATQNFNGGLLALPSNIGLYTRDRFTVIPELTMTLSYHFNENVRAFVGYNFLYWSNVLRAGDQIDPVIDQNQIPNFGATAPAVAGGSHPIVPFKQTDFWAQGINFGLEFRY